MKRLVIITDSLGMPRDEILIDRTWTSKIIREFGKYFEIYFFPKRACTTNDIANNLVDLIVRINPDIIICQVGIVDGLRRALHKNVLSVIKRIPVLRKIIHYSINKNHYLLTRIYDIKYVRLNKFERNIERIINSNKLNNENMSNYAFIKIAAPGQNLIKKVYNCANDIEVYNNKLYEISRKHKFNIIDPYKYLNTDEFLISDGFHLNEYGNDLVYNAIKLYLDKYI